MGRRSRNVRVPARPLSIPQVTLTVRNPHKSDGERLFVVAVVAVAVAVAVVYSDDDQVMIMFFLVNSLSGRAASSLENSGSEVV